MCGRDVDAGVYVNGARIGTVTAFDEQTHAVEMELDECRYLLDGLLAGLSVAPEPPTLSPEMIERVWRRAHDPVPFHTGTLHVCIPARR